MRFMEELENMPHLVIVGRVADIPKEYEVYHGWVMWEGFRATVVFGFNEAGCMEHVSVSPNRKKQVPTWEDMCRLKDMFFYPEEMAVQVHPAESRYLHGVGTEKNRLENVLHLWRPKDGDFGILNHPERWD